MANATFQDLNGQQYTVNLLGGPYVVADINGNQVLFGNGIQGATGTQGITGIQGSTGTQGVQGTSGSGNNPLPTYTLGTLPSPVVPGELIFVSDATAGAGAIAFGNTAATNWINPTTGVAVA